NDELSGVATTTAVLDGKPFSSGGELAVDAIGPHLLRIEAADQAGNPQVATAQFDGIYPFKGFLEPVLNDGSGIYKLGKILLLRFELKAPGGASIPTAKGSFSLAKTSETISGTRRVKLKKKGAPDSGTAFHYDPVAKT